MSRKLKCDLFAEAGGLPVGCELTGGVLTPALSGSEYGTLLPEGIYAAFYSSGTQRYYAFTRGNAYYSDVPNVFTWTLNMPDDAKFFFEDVDGFNPRSGVINGKTVRALRKSGNSMTFMSLLDLDYELSCGVVHCGRLFGADKADGCLLRWSGEGNIEDCKESLRGGGKLRLDSARGEILGLVVFGGKLTAVRRRGLTVLNMYGSPENFSVGLTDTDTDEIIKNTACAAGGKLLFFTASGLHCFDGSAVTKFGFTGEGDVRNPRFAVACGEYCYLGCESARLGRRVLYRIDALTGESYVIDVAADAVCFSNRPFAYAGRSCYRLETGGRYEYLAETDFGAYGNKTVTRMVIGGTADVEISNGRLTRKFSGVSGAIRPRLRGKKFTIRLTGETPVTALTAEAEARDAV